MFPSDMHSNNIDKKISVMEDFADNVAKLCQETYNSLKKTGKPNAREWTVLSGIVMKSVNGLSLVALATGTKCLGESELINNPEEKASRLSDSHAEVLTRRAFVRYLYDQIDLTLSSSKSAVFSRNDKNKIELNSGISFHFFSSQTPCGDCSIFHKQEIYDAAPLSKISRLNEDINGPVITELCYRDLYRTGAKCVKGEEIKDPRLPGENYHITGPLRTKPGRGNPTSSLSCSDKIAKWLILGLQGSFLSLVIPSIKLESIIIGGNCPFSLDAMERGLYKRFGNEIDRPKIYQSKISFMHQREDERSHPCPTSIIWCAMRDSVTVEVAVAGRKQGATKKKKSSNLFVSRQMLLQTFLEIFDKYQNYYHEIRHPKKIMYYDWKQWSISYQNKWQQLKLESFHNWPSKPLDFRNFAL